MNSDLGALDAAATEAATATPWESADIQLARVRQFVLGDIAAAIGGLILLGIFYAVWQPSWVWPPVIAVVASLGVLFYALRLLRRRDLSSAVFAVASSFWFVIPAITYILPLGFGAFSLAAIWPVLLATPYVDRVTLRRLITVTFPIALLSLGLSLRDDPFGVADTLGPAVTNLSLFGVGVTFVCLTLLMIWAYNSRLQETLAGLQETNAQLAANEHQLEVKVAARTAEFESASAYLQAVIENLPQGLATLDRSGFLLERNAAFVDQFETDHPAHRLEDLPIELQQVIGSLDDDLATRRHDPVEDVAFVALSRDRIGKAMATPITIENSLNTETIGAVVLIDDVTAERQVDRMKTDFISTVSHELRTPLTSVLGFARIIQKRLEERIFPHVDTSVPGTDRAMRQVGENLTIILGEGGRLTNLINDVLDISKMEARQVDWNFEALELASIVDTAVDATASLFEDGLVDVHLYVEPDLPLVKGDHQRLVQVVINLLSNAHKFTTVGSVSIDIFSTTSASSGGTSEAPMVSLVVTDTGIGIADDDLPLLFERFRQVGDSLTDRPTGTGLGLPICREIVGAHGGTIDAKSEPGVGTAFEVRLPIAVDEPDRVEPSRDVSPTPQSTAPVATLDPSMERSRPHVLVVDDDDGVRSLVTALFEAEGYRTTQAASGEAAISLAAAERPDLVTLDVLMPGMSGIDTALALRTSAITATVPLMFISVLDRIPSPSIGGDAHITKPIDAEKMLRLARELLERDPASHDDVVVVNASADVLTSVVDGLERFGYERVEALGARRQDGDGTRLVIANGPADAGHAEVNRWTFRRGNDELVVIAFETEQTRTDNPTL